MRSRPLFTLFVVAGFSFAGISSAAGRDVGTPVAVSPGSASGGLIESRCPSFSWGQVEGARSYEIVVYRLEESLANTQAVTAVRIAGSALSWTPDLSHCLERGASYAWSVRALDGDAISDWSPPRLFELASTPSVAELEEALAVVQSYLRAHSDTRAEEAVREPAAAAPTMGRADDGKKGTAGAPPAATQLSVEGNVDATSFTGDGSNLAGVATDAALISHTATPDAHHLPIVDTDTTCDGVTCDGASFTNLDADNLTAGTVAEALVDAALTRDAELMAAIEALSSPYPRILPVAGGAGATINATGPASPYPSTLTVAGFGGTLTDVDVTLEGLSHVFPDDLDILLVAPGGEAVLLMADAGGGNGLTGIDLTFDDEAEQSVPNAAQITDGFYRPANHGLAVFPAPAPSGPYSTTLSMFDSLDPNGVWELFVFDDSFPDSGSLVSWSLTLADAADVVPVPVSGGGTGATDAVAAIGNLGAASATALDDHELNTAAHHAEPTTLPPSGAAGGALSGSYPDPGIAANAVTDEEMAIQQVDGTAFSLSSACTTRTESCPAGSGLLSGGVTLVTTGALGEIMEVVESTPTSTTGWKATVCCRSTGAPSSCLANFPTARIVLLCVGP